MYLKRLSVQGFKSFANRTSFDYGRGITAVVGPNGSGKSNVSDALRWVLGEQSSRLLRAKKQEDVIFAGTGSRSAVGMAEVLLTLDNEEHWLPLEFSEVEIGRRVYRSGESEYLLNGSKVRLRDVTDLLMKGDVGQNSYSIMGQGLVDEVLSMSPDERRSFLDEAADVKRFRMKVKEAQERLTANHLNTEKLAVIVAEIEPRLKQLSRQAERAADHRRLSAELAQLLRLAYAYRWHDAENTLTRVRAALDQRTAEGVEAAARVELLRGQVATLSDEIRKRREAIAHREQERNAVAQRIRAAEQALAIESERQKMVTQRHDEVLRDIEALQGEQESISSTDEKASGQADIVAETEAARQHVLQCRAVLESTESEYSQVRRALRELRERMETSQRQAAAAEADLRRAQRRISELEYDASQAAMRRRQLIGELKAYGRRFAEARSALLTGSGAIDSAQAAAETTRGRLEKLQRDVATSEKSRAEEQREIDHLVSRLEALRRVQAELEGVATGTRNVLRIAHGDGLPQVHGIAGLLIHQLHVPAGLEAAINAALGHWLQAIVVDDATAAFTAVDILSTGKLGRAQFLPVDSMRQTRPLNLQREDGVIGVASQLIRCDPPYQPLVDTLLGRVIVVADLAAAQRTIRRGLGAVVTLDGTFIDQSGTISGGATGSDEGVFARQRELDELPARIGELQRHAETTDRQLATARDAVRQLQQDSDANQHAYDRIRHEVEAARATLARERDSLHRLRREMDASRSREVQLAREQTARRQAMVEARTALTGLRQQHDDREREAAAAEERFRAVGEHRESALRAVTEANARMTMLDGERRARAAVEEQQQRAIKRLTGQVAARREQLTALKADAEGLETKIAGLREELVHARSIGAEGNYDPAPDRDELNRLETHERQVQAQLSAAQAELLRLDRERLDTRAELERAESLIETLRVEMDREGFTADSTGNIVTSEDTQQNRDLAVQTEEDTYAVQGGATIDIAATEARIAEIRRQVRRLGPVNNDAPEDFEELQTRHTFLSAQLHDLEDAEAQLREAIVELNAEIRVRFAKAFELVNRAFGEYFQAFFGGGSASLLLTDPSNLAEAGIEIEAQPPGKRLKSMNLLSGGERSLTAVALLFALLTANPAPFCVLDEVDAALDEANVGRFTSALKKLAEKTQFLVVTHNRRTVEVADAIYGVSMMRDGVSKVLSLRIGDLSKN